MIAFQDHIRAHIGFAPESIYPNRIVRFATCERKGDRAGWCKLFADERGGVYGDWRSQTSGTWFADVSRPNDDRERERRRRETAKARAQERAQRLAAWGAARSKLDELWRQSRPIEANDPVDLYLRDRGLGMKSYPNVLRYHPSLAYWDDSLELSGVYPAMLAKVEGATGDLITIHRTYLTTDGKKAPVPTPRKLMPTAGRLEGASVHLEAPRKVDEHLWLGVAEGIETAIAASMIYGVPTVAAISAGGLTSFVVSAGVESLVVFADNDASGVGASAALRLAGRVSGSGITTRVLMPERVGSDWADVWLETAGSNK